MKIETEDGAQKLCKTELARAVPDNLSRKSGDSIYQINLGDCFKFEPVPVYNRKLKATADHYRYIWIQYIGAVPAGQPPKYRRHTIANVWVPVNGDTTKVFVKAGQVKRNHLCLLMKQFSFEKVAEKVFFNSTDASWARFYRKVGIIE